jgi:glutamyl-tRNA reductase
MRALLVAGLSHATAGLDVRERLAVAEPALPDVLAAVRAAGRLAEALVLGTCNRVEVWGVEQDGDAAAALTGWLAARAGDAAERVAGLVYVHRGAAAVRHMAAVAAGLDSMVVGEPQILGQVKAAHAAAVAHQAAGAELGAAVSEALRIAKRVRSETEVGRGALSVASAAVELARKIFGDLAARDVLLVGAGEMGELAARHFAQLGVRRLAITSRTAERAQAVARETGGTPVAFDDWLARAAEADVVIAAVAAPEVLVTRARAEAWIARRPRPLLIVDLGVPRNVERSVGQVAEVYVYDVDDLASVVEANRLARAREVERGRALVAEAVARLERRTVARGAAPTIRSLRAKLEDIRRAEVARAAAALRDGSPEARAALDAMSIALVNKILHGPIEALKQAQAAPGGRSFGDLVREMFGLGREDERAEPREEVEPS